MIKKRPPRLDQTFVIAPVYFVTFCTRDRHQLPSLPMAHQAFVDYATRAERDFNIAVGRYVMMPDHVHLFVCGDADFELSKWVGGLKRAISAAFIPQRTATTLAARIFRSSAAQRRKLRAEVAIRAGEPGPRWAGDPIGGLAVRRRDCADRPGVSSVRRAFGLL